MPATICRSSPPTSTRSTSKRSAFGWSSADFTVATRSSIVWNSARVAIDSPFESRDRLERLRLEPAAELAVVGLGELAELEVELGILDRGERLVLLPEQSLGSRRHLLC